MALIVVGRDVANDEGDAMASGEDTSLPWSSTRRRVLNVEYLNVFVGVQRVESHLMLM